VQLFLQFFQNVVVLNFRQDQRLGLHLKLTVSLKDFMIEATVSFFRLKFQQYQLLYRLF
jgi:hypothetical protein